MEQWLFILRPHNTLRGQTTHFIEC